MTTIEETPEAVAEPATPAELVDALLEHLGHEPGEVAKLEIQRGRIRVLSKDRSMRSHSADVMRGAE